ncbi:MAG: response regulator [Bacteriovoracaceae bacterium]|nr:response regulator [Bacteriovoracaceae bacterium]NUM60495.1 response regulator [Pseudobdellovibrionaceae bacterium]
MKKAIYVIEDDPISQIMIKTLLNQAGVEGSIFENYQSALNKIREDKMINTLPLAIFSDFMLPDGDGLDFLNQLRQLIPSEKLPFYFITGVQKEMIEPFVEKHQYSAIISKPLHKDELNVIIASLTK